MYKLAISRPITTLMFSLAFIFFGILSLKKLPVALFPEIDFPFVTITTSYPGASAEIIESKVTDKIEEAVMGIDGLKEVTSTSSNNVSVVMVEFVLEKPVEVAVNDVRDKVSAVKLASGVDNPVITKFNTAGDPVIRIFMSSDRVDAPTMMKYANNVVQPILQRIEGVGGVELSGYRERQINIRANPTAMNKYGITYSQLQNIISNSNIQIDGGQIISEKRQWAILTDANARKIDDLRNIRIAEGVKLSDVAEIEDGLAENNTYAAYNKTPGVIFEIIKIAGKNDIDIADNVYKIIPTLQSMSPDYNITAFRDSTIYIRDSVKDVEFDLLLGAFLAVSVVFLFLRNLSITIVSALSIPISIMGTFAFVHMMGLSLNMLTLIALTLSIGLIIDDAIVVIENIQKKIDAGLKRREAAYEGVKEIGFAIIAISAMLLSVFVPIGSMDGITGRFFQGFGITVSLAIITSYIVVTTCIPMFSSILINNKQTSFYIKTIPFFKKIDDIYLKALEFVLHHKWQVILGIFVFTFLSFFLVSRLGVTFIQEEDRSEFKIYLKTNPGISIEQMKKDVIAIQNKVQENKDVAFTTIKIGGGKKLFTQGDIYVKLVPLKDRTQSQFTIMDNMAKELKNLPEAKNFSISASEIDLVGGGGDSSPFQIALYGDPEGLQKSAEALKALLLSNSKITNYHSSGTEYQPEYKLTLLRQNASKYGITPQDVGLTVQAALSGSSEIAYFTENGKEYNITLRVPDSQMVSINDLQKIQILTSDNNLMFLDGLVEITETMSPSSISRFNRERNMTVYASPVQGSKYTVGDIIKFVESNQNKWLDKGVHYRLQGEAQNSSDAAASFGIAIATAFVLIYFILAALYESLLAPLIIMITLPLSFSGAFIAMYIFGLPMSLFSMMGLMLLMGLVGKNATLLLDMAEINRENGHNLHDAIVLAGEDRLRPILMTTIAMIFGMLPLAISTGQGSSMKAPLGISVIGGLLVSMVLSLLIVPAFYSYLAKVDDKLKSYYKPKADDKI